MRARIERQILFLHRDDVPAYKKTGSIVRNSYFWALRSIADRANFNQEWEFADIVWPALGRMLLSFSESGYLGYRETILELPLTEVIPPPLQPASTWYDPEEEAEAETQ